MNYYAHWMNFTQVNIHPRFKPFYSPLFALIVSGQTLDWPKSEQFFK